MLHALIPGLGAAELGVAAHGGTGHVFGKRAARAQGPILELAELVVPLLDGGARGPRRGEGLLVSGGRERLFHVLGHVHTAHVLSVEVLAVEDGAVGDVLLGAAGDRLGSLVLVLRGGCRLGGGGVGGNGIGAVARVGALVLLADPVVEQEMLRRDVSLPLVLAGKGGLAAGKVKDACVAATVLLPNVLLQCQLVSKVSLLAATRFAARVRRFWAVSRGGREWARGHLRQGRRGWSLRVGHRPGWPAPATRARRWPGVVVGLVSLVGYPCAV